MPAFDEETFGPVAAVVRANDEADAIRIANGSQYGLGASVWTADRARGERVARAIEAGGGFVNALGKSDPPPPFGGGKRPGLRGGPAGDGARGFGDNKTEWGAARWRAPRRLP